MEFKIKLAQIYNEDSCPSKSKDITSGLNSNQRIRYAWCLKNLIIQESNDDIVRLCKACPSPGCVQSPNYLSWSVTTPVSPLMIPISLYCSTISGTSQRTNSNKNLKQETMRSELCGWMFPWNLQSPSLESPEVQSESE